jgi:hypothetical protein
MPEALVDRLSPLGEFLEGSHPKQVVLMMAGTGTYEGDWGFSTESEENENEESEEGSVGAEEGRRDFAPPNRIPVTRGLKPLFMGDNHVSQPSKIYHLFTVQHPVSSRQCLLCGQTAFSLHVPPPETARFQERLRYVICTSQLLSEKSTPSLYPESPTNDPLDTLLRRGTTRYWIGTGGCIIVVALLVSWTLRDPPTSKIARAKNLAAFALGALIAVYLYAHTVKTSGVRG